MTLPAPQPSFARALRRLPILMLAAACLLLASPAGALRPLVLLVPYPAGALSDSVARVVAPALASTLGQAVIVENLGGASGALAAGRAANAPADGELLLQGSPNELILAPEAQPDAGFAAEDFRMLQIIGSAPLLVVVRRDLPAATLGELLALARSDSADRPLSYGSVGVGSLYHLLARHLAERIGATMIHVPYRGGAPLLRDLVGGVIDFAILPAGARLLALAHEQRVRLLGTLEPARARTRRAALPALPSVATEAHLPDFTYSIWSGYFVRADTSLELAQHLNAALAVALREPQVRARIAAQGANPMPPMTLGQAQAYYERETARSETGEQSPRPE